MKQLRVMIVDDSLVIRAMMAGILEQDPAISVVAVSGSTGEADAALATQRVDVMTLDIDLPDGNGLDYLSRPLRRGIPVIMISGQTIEGSDINGSALAKGAIACFDKSQAMSRASALVALVKAAGLHKVRLSAADNAAWARVRAAADAG